MSITGYQKLIAESRRLARELIEAEEAGNEERIGQIAFRQMDISDNLRRYNKRLAQIGVNLLVKELVA